MTIICLHDTRESVIFINQTLLINADNSYLVILDIRREVNLQIKGTLRCITKDDSCRLPDSG